jgi:hypothetical protein
VVPRVPRLPEPQAVQAAAVVGITAALVGRAQQIKVIREARVQTLVQTAVMVAVEVERLQPEQTEI